MLIYCIVQRLELLYRPTYSLHPTATARGRTAQQPEVVLTNFSSTGAANSSSPTPPPANDPPPKYTPPPSYSTATGARIARMIREVMVAAHFYNKKNVKVN
jgi:solute carrier family 6 (neurotransmitter transporter)